MARDELPRCRPDVLLSDLGLPDGDGTDLIRDITENATDWHPHILVYSGYSDESRVMEAIEAGADGYLLKGCLEVGRLKRAQALGGAVSMKLGRCMSLSCRRARLG